MNTQKDTQITTELKRKAMALGVTIQIGKSGINQSVIDEIIKQLKKRKLIKIKFLRAILDQKSKKELVDEIITKTKAKIIMKTGFTLVLQYIPAPKQRLKTEKIINKEF